MRLSGKMLVAGLLVLAVPVGMALAEEPIVGNPVMARTGVDTYSDFTVIDTNHPVSAAANLTLFQFYAANRNPFEFVLVDENNVVQWISPTIRPAAAGVQSYKTASPVPVQAGWNLGVHSDSTGVVAFDTGGSNIVSTANHSGKPAAGSTLKPFSIPSGSFSRTYSLAGE